MISDRKELMTGYRSGPFCQNGNRSGVGIMPTTRCFVPFLICFLATFSAIDVLRKLSMGG